jgi:uncharacterized integral membrane protein (TIGR00697 family)
MINIKKFDLVISLYVFGVLCAEIMGTKTFPLLHIGSFQLNSSVAVFLMPLLFILPDIIVEVYGRARAQSVVFSGLLAVTLLIFFSLLATHLPPSHHFEQSEAAYDRIFGYTARIAVASITAFGISELLDVLIFSKLRQAMNTRALWLRNIVSNVVSQFADSTIFLTLAFYSLQLSISTNVSFLFGLILPYWLLRCALTVLETPLVYAGVWWLKDNNDPEQIGTPYAR